METINKIEEYLNNEKTEEAKKLLNKLKDYKDLFLYYTAEIIRIEGFMERSIYYYKKALTTTKNKEIKFNILLKLVSLYRTIGDKKNAKKYLTQAKKINPNSAQLLIEKAMYFRLIENYQKAIKIFKRIYSYYLKNSDYQAVSYIQWALGGIYRNTGDLKKSINSFEKSIRYAKIAKDNSLLLYSTLGLAGVLRISGDIKKSYKLYKISIKKSPKTDLFAQAYSFCGTGNALRQLGKIREALRHYKIALKLYKKIKDNPDTALVLWGIAECYKKINPKKSLIYIKEAKKLIKKSYEMRGKILLKRIEAELKYIDGKKNQAKNLFEEAYKLSKKHKLNTLVETFG